jgi:4-amino-4-deoxy-L-arabinose transferase-like glycosyltransferase
VLPEGVPARVSRRVVAALTVALALRLLFAFGYWIDKPLTHDEREYLELGRNVAAGKGFTYDPPSGNESSEERFGRAPLYPLLISAVAAVVPAHVPSGTRAVQALLGVLSVALIAWLAARAGGEQAGTIAAWIAAVYPPFVWLPAYVLSESLYLPLALANLLVLGGVLDRTDAARPLRDSRRLFVSGVLGGLAALTRPAHLFFLLASGVWLLAKRHVRWALVMTLGALLAIAPWTLRNVREYGRFVLIASEGGVTFWTGNHPLSGGEGDMAANPAIKRDNQRLRAEHPGLTAEQLEPIYYREALHVIADRPWWWLSLEARKFLYLWVPLGPSYTLHSTRYLAATLVSYGALLPFGVIGLIGLARAGRWPSAIGVLLASGILTSLVFLPQERFRIPVIDPVLVIGAAVWLAARTRPSPDALVSAED